LFFPVPANLLKFGGVDPVEADPYSVDGEAITIDDARRADHVGSHSDGYD
jgi:hypothetical protein